MATTTDASGHVAADLPSEFITYSPDIDSLSPKFEENLEMVIQGVERRVAASVTTEGAGQAVRFAHAKAYGYVRGEVEVLDGLPIEYAQGIYARPAIHDALIRFSNGAAQLGADTTLPNGTGLALKIFGVAGRTLLDDEPDAGTFDYANINAPIFFCNTVAHYLFIHNLFTELPAYFAQGKPGRNRFYHDYLTGKGTLAEKDWIWDELFAFLTVAKTPAVNLLLSTYWTMGAVRHGDYIAKVRIAPVTAFADKVIQRSILRNSAPEVYRPALVAELQARPYEFDIQVQLCTDLARMPVQDVTVEWPEQLSPPVTVAKLRIPRQDISGDNNLEKMDGLSFTPWRVTAEHAPLGETMRLRKEVYRRASILRHQLNRQDRREARSIAEALA
jgi:catalase